MTFRKAALLASLAVVAAHLVLAQGTGIEVPKTVEAGKSFSIQCSGNGRAILYIIGPGQVVRRDVQLGQPALFSAGSLYNAGHYLAVLAGGSSRQQKTFDVIAATQPAELSFLAKPSRLPVGLHDGITGAVYVFDAYHNLVTVPMRVSFELANPVGAVQTRTMITHEGAAWTTIDSTAQQGNDRFVVRLGGISNLRVIGQVPGDPCGLKMNASQSGSHVHLVTDPVRDCSGNAVPDGTVVTFTETYNGTQSTVDVPLKRGIAEVEMPAYSGARISIASGVVLGNEIRWEGK